MGLPCDPKAASSQQAGAEPKIAGASASSTMPAAGLTCLSEGGLAFPRVLPAMELRVAGSAPAPSLQLLWLSCTPQRGGALQQVGGRCRLESAAHLAPREP